MELFKRMEPFWLLVMFLGALNWGILGVFGTNVLAEVFGSGDALNAAYTVIGIAALFSLPRLMESMMHIDMHRPHAHGM
jgi:uncharacterized membrane protein YuzA (DUF378 family)